MSSMTVSVVPASSVPNFANYPASSKVPVTPGAAAPSSTAASSTTPGANSADSAVQKFEQYANMTPAQRLHAEMLAQLGMTLDGPQAGEVAAACARIARRMTALRDRRRRSARRRAYRRPQP